MATYFEASALPGLEDDPNGLRNRRLGELDRMGRLLSLDEIAVLCGPTADRPTPAGLHAQCWGLFAFLLELQPQEENPPMEW